MTFHIGKSETHLILLYRFLEYSINALFSVLISDIFYLPDSKFSCFKNSRRVSHFVLRIMDSNVLNSEELQGGSNMTGTDLYVNKPNCAAAVRP